jgi:23S rRNA pseudouridine955/2504/2580 synthase
MNGLSKASASTREAGEESRDQRIDNYLQKLLKGVPKSHIYRILRSGEIRVNSGRVDATYRVQPGDRIRIPPIRTAEPAARKGRIADFTGKVLFEDEDLLVVDKPAGVAVHGGSGISTGVIEQMRAARTGLKFLELAHRLDRDTSGLLVLAKKRSALVDVHEQLRLGQVKKHYLTLVLGEWKDDKRNVRLALHKFVNAAGERRVVVNEEEGVEAHTVFRLERALRGCSLLDAELKTGRTHQIRVHLAHLGFPIAGDDKYGDFAANKNLAKTGLKRMFLHAWRLELRHPRSGDRVRLEAPLPDELSGYLAGLEKAPRSRA